MITSQAPGARVTIDGEPPGGEPAPAIRVVAPGTRRVRVTAPGFSAAEQSVTAVDERLVVTAVDLAPLPGRIRVTSETDGSTVFVDGQPIGKTPLDHSGLVPGRHALAVSHRGHKL